MLRKSNGQSQMMFPLQQQANANSLTGERKKVIQYLTAIQLIDRASRVYEDDIDIRQSGAWLYPVNLRRSKYAISEVVTLYPDLADEFINRKMQSILFHQPSLNQANIVENIRQQVERQLDETLNAPLADGNDLNLQDTLHAFAIYAAGHLFKRLFPKRDIAQVCALLQKVDLFILLDGAMRSRNAEFLKCVLDLGVDVNTCYVSPQAAACHAPMVILLQAGVSYFLPNASASSVACDVPTRDTILDFLRTNPDGTPCDYPANESVVRTETDVKVFQQMVDLLFDYGAKVDVLGYAALSGTPEVPRRQQLLQMVDKHAQGDASSGCVTVKKAAEEIKAQFDSLPNLTPVQKAYLAVVDGVANAPQHRMKCAI